MVVRYKHVYNLKILNLHHSALQGIRGVWVPQVHFVGDLVLQILKVSKALGALPPNPLHFLHTTFFLCLDGFMFHTCTPTYMVFI